MKKYLRNIYLLVFFQTAVVNSFAQHIKPGETFTIPVKRVIGKSNIKVTYVASPTEESELLKNFAIPRNIIDYRILSLHFNPLQHHYYKYKTTNSHKDFLQFARLKQSMRYDTSLLQSRKINEDITIFYGVNKDSSKTIIVDANNNEDLSDDTVIILPKSLNGQSKETSLPIVEIKDVEYPVRNGIVKQHFFIRLDPYGDETSLVRNFLFWPINVSVHEYGEGTFRINGKDFLVQFTPAVSSDYYEPVMLKILIVPLRDSARKNFSEYDMCVLTETFEVDGIIIRPESVSRFNDSITILYRDVDTSSIGAREGKKATNFRVDDINGEVLELSKINAGKYVMLDFWGSWCKPCMDGIPELVATYEKLKRTGKFEFIGIANEVNDDLKKVVAVVKKYKMDWLHISDPLTGIRFDGLSNQFRVKVWPTGILINPEGRIIKVAGGEKGMGELMNMMMEIAGRNE